MPKHQMGKFVEKIFTEIKPLGAFLLVT